MLLKNLKIKEIGGLGDGVAELDGKKIFVPYTAAGDIIDADMKRENRDGITAKLIKIITPSESRITPPCPYFAKCGGCSLQHINEKAYRDFKYSRFIAAIKNSGCKEDYGIDNIHWLGAASRRRVEFKIKNGKLGFFEAESNNIVDIKDCTILIPQIGIIIESLKSTLLSAPGSENFKSISLTYTDTGIDAIIETTKRPELPLLEYAPEIAYRLKFIRLSFKIDNRIETLFSSATPQIKSGNHMIDFPVGGFVQSTKEGQEILTGFVAESLKDSKNIMDLFSGIGVYGFALAGEKNIRAADSDDKMISALNIAIRKNNVSKFSAETRDLMSRPFTADELKDIDGVAINPPRVGAIAQVKELAKSSVNKIAMVSCNPASFSRDAKILLDSGYKITKAGAIDQFVYSPHLEIIALFIK